jgi:tripartite-type tricarboxylate transporter receptor subunit TctC
MFKAVLILCAYLLIGTASAQETIVIKSPYNATHAGHAAFYKIIAEANSAQKKYNFVLQLKPGAQGVVALRDLDKSPNDSLAIIAAAFIENYLTNQINKDSYVPITALGDACWFLVSKVGDETLGIDSLADTTDELVISGVGIGTAIHLLSFEISAKIKRPIEFIAFKSAAEGNILLVGDHKINLGLMPLQEYENLKSKNRNLKLLALHCDVRHRQAPNIKTTREQGIVSPPVFNTVVASVNMNPDKRTELADILDKALLAIGKDEILDLSQFNPPIFNNIGVEAYHKSKTDMMESALKKHSSEIEKSR